MSASENNDKKKLSPEEIQKVRSYLEGQFKDATVAAPQVNYISADAFAAAKKKVFDENRELLARLAK